jgi:hypothetical protein
MQVVIRNLNFKKFLLQNSPLPQLKPLIALAYEGCQPAEDDEVHTLALKCLIQLACLPQIQLGNGSRKCYIPGETLDMERLHQKSIDYGLLSLLAHLDMSLPTKLKTVLEKDFWAFVGEDDFT